MNKIKMNKKEYFECPLCGLKYKEENWMKKCKEWCNNHNSCNIEVINHAVNKNYKIKN